jgi:hypothetical protein
MRASHVTWRASHVTWELTGFGNLRASATGCNPAASSPSTPKNKPTTTNPCYPIFTSLCAHKLLGRTTNQAGIAKDVFAEDLRLKLVSLGYAEDDIFMGFNPEVALEFLKNTGGIHCATNLIPKLPKLESGGTPWWK